MLETLPNALLLELFEFWEPIFILSTVSRLSQKWYTLCTQYHLKGTLRLSACQTERLLDLLFFDRSAPVSSPQSLRQLTQPFPPAEGPSGCEQSFVTDRNHENCLTVSGAACVRPGSGGSPVQSAGENEAQGGLWTSPQGCGSPPSSYALQRRFSRLEGIELRLPVERRNRIGLCCLLHSVLPVGIKHLHIGASSVALDSLAWAESYASQPKRPSTNVSVMEEEEEDLRSASYNPPNNAPYTTCEIRSGHAHDPAAAATSQQTGTISRTPTPAGSRREFSRPNCQLPCADRNSRDGVPWPVDEGVWLTAEDWGPVFHRFRTLQTLSVCTCCRLGYMARPLVKLALPRTEEVKAEALNGDSDLRGCGRFGCPCRQRLLYHLEELVVTQITSESFHICSGCYLPGLRRLRLGFIEISIGHHNIRAFLQRTALPVSSPLHAREERCVWHPLEELCLHCDEDDDEQLRLALLLNRIVGQIASYQRSERSSDSLGAGVHNSGRRVSTPLWPNPQPPEATGQDAENGVRSHDEDRWQSFYPVTRSVRLPMQQYDAQHGSSNDSAFMTAASDDDEPWSTLRITERHGHGHHSPASTVGGICLPYLAILQVPRIGLLSPALPSAAPQLAHLRSFESWEFFSATQAWPLQPQIEASSDATVPLCSVFDCEADMPKEDPQRYATFVEAIQKGVIPVPSGEISDIGLRDTRRGSSLEEQNSDASDASVNLHSCCTHGNDTYGSLQNSLSTWGPDQGTPTLRCRFVFKRRLPSATRLSVPKGTKPPLLQYASRFAWSFLSIIKTPSVLRLQELLAELPYMRSIAFYHSLDIYQLAGLQWALQPYARRWCPSHQQCHQRGFASPDSPARRSTCTSNVRAVVFVHPEGCGHLAECRAEANRRLWTSVPNDCQTHGPQDASEHLPTLQLRLWRGVEPWMLVSSCTPLSRPLNNTSSPSKIATRHEAGCTPPGAQAIATASDVTVNRDQPSAQLPPRGALLLTAGVQLDRFFSPST